MKRFGGCSAHRRRHGDAVDRSPGPKVGGEVGQSEFSLADGDGVARLPPAKFDESTEAHKPRPSLHSSKSPPTAIDTTRQVVHDLSSSVHLARYIGSLSVGFSTPQGRLDSWCFWSYA